MSIAEPQGFPGDLMKLSFDCLIVATECGNMRLLQDLNCICAKEKRHFYPVVLQNMIGYVGPLVIPGESACYDDCATAWPPVPAADGMTLPPGIAGTLSAIERTDGSQQMAYNDIPLYYYAGDTTAGDTTGQDVGDVWYIVTPDMQLGDEPHEGEEGHEMGEESATPASS